MSNNKFADHKLCPNQPWSPSNANGFISIDLIGPFETTTRVNQYVLTVTCMLMNYAMCVSVVYKSAFTVVKSYLREVYCRFEGSQKILSNNGSEFEYSLFSEVSSQLGIKHIYYSPYSSQENGRKEAKHQFLKNCIRKFTQKGEAELDKIVTIAFIVYNIFPNSHSRESCFFLKFGRDTYIPTLAHLMQPKLRLR